MLSVNEARAIMRAGIQNGNPFAVISNDLKAEIRASTTVDQLLHIAADKLLSLAVLTERNDDGERLAFTDKDEAGERIIIHLEYTNDVRALRRAGLRRVQTGKRQVKEGYAMIARADQLELEFPQAA